MLFHSFILGGWRYDAQSRALSTCSRRRKGERGRGGEREGENQKSFSPLSFWDGFFNLPLKKLSSFLSRENWRKGAKNEQANRGKNWRIQLGEKERKEGRKWMEEGEEESRRITCCTPVLSFPSLPFASSSLSLHLSFLLSCSLSLPSLCYSSSLPSHHLTRTTTFILPLEVFFYYTIPI